MITLKDRLLLSLSLAVLFGAGVGSGYLFGKRAGATLPPVSAAPPALPEGGVTASPAEWWNRALDRLGQDLHLSGSQKEAIRPMLEHSGEKMFLNRDRALFQIHLELLSFHEILSQRPGLLDAAQQERLAALRTGLRTRIESQFPQFLKDSPLPANPTVSSNSP